MATEESPKIVKIGMPCPCCLTNSLERIKAAVATLEEAQRSLPISGCEGSKANRKAILKFMKTYMKSIETIHEATHGLYATVKESGKEDN